MHTRIVVGRVLVVYTLYQLRFITLSNSLAYHRLLHSERRGDTLLYKQNNIYLQKRNGKNDGHRLAKTKGLLRVCPFAFVSSLEAGSLTIKKLLL